MIGDGKALYSPEFLTVSSGTKPGAHPGAQQALCMWFHSLLQPPSHESFTETAPSSATASFHGQGKLTPFQAMNLSGPPPWLLSVLRTRRSPTPKQSCLFLASAPAAAISVPFLIHKSVCSVPSGGIVYRLPSQQ